MQGELEKLTAGKQSAFKFNRKTIPGEGEMTANPIRSVGREAILVTLTEPAERFSRKAQDIPNDLEELNDAAKRLISLPDENSVFDHLLKVLHEKHPDSYIVLNIKEPGKDLVKVRNIYGLDDTLFGRAIRLIGFSPVGKSYELTGRNIELLKTGRLMRYEKGFEDFVSGYLPAGVPRKIMGLSGIKDIYLLGLKRGDILLAEIQLYFRTTGPGPNALFTEALAQLAAEVLHRKYLEKGLMESENKFRGLAEQSTDGILIADHNASIIHWNTAMESITGLSRGEALGKNLWAFRLANTSKIFPPGATTITGKPSPKP